MRIQILMVPGAESRFTAKLLEYPSFCAAYCGPYQQTYHHDVLINGLGSASAPLFGSKAPMVKKHKLATGWGRGFESLRVDPNHCNRLVSTGHLYSCRKRTPELPYGSRRPLAGASRSATPAAVRVSNLPRSAGDGGADGGAGREGRPRSRSMGCHCVAGVLPSRSITTLAITGLAGIATMVTPAATATFCSPFAI
jgi:hypothetical protein